MNIHTTFVKKQPLYMCIHMHMHMTKVISLSNSAYAEMKAMKREGESFSDVVHRIVHPAPKKSIMEFAGILKDSAAEWEQIKKDIYESRKHFRMREVKF